MTTQSEIIFPESPFLNKREGYICSCCGQFVKEYSRKLNSSMAIVLIIIYKAQKYDFFHVENWLEENGLGRYRADYHKLRFWGLLTKKVDDREDGSPRNGFYKITGRGIMFAERKITVQEKAIIFNNECNGFEGKEIYIDQAGKFNYEELMNQ